MINQDNLSDISMPKIASREESIQSLKDDANV